MALVISLAAGVKHELKFSTSNYDKVFFCGTRYRSFCSNTVFSFNLDLSVKQYVLLLMLVSYWKSK